MQQIVDPETGRVCQAGEHGEICAKTDVLTLGYLNSEEQNKQLFDSEGFLRTGDIGYYKENGDLFYVERMKGLMKYVVSFVTSWKAVRTNILSQVQEQPRVSC